MASLADIANQLASMNSSNPQSQQQWQAQLANRAVPLSYNDWQQGSFQGKELAGMDRKYYNQFADKYYGAGTEGRNDLLREQGLQFPTWGWQADKGIAALPGPVSWADGGNLAAMRGGEGIPGGRGGPMASRGRDLGLGPLSGLYGRMERRAEDFGDRYGGTIGGIGVGPAEQEFGNWGGYENDTTGLNDGRGGPAEEDNGGRGRGPGGMF